MRLEINEEINYNFFLHHSGNPLRSQFVARKRFTHVYNLVAFSSAGEKMNYEPKVAAVRLIAARNCFDGYFLPVSAF